MTWNIWFVGYRELLKSRPRALKSTSERKEQKRRKFSSLSGLRNTFMKTEKIKWRIIAPVTLAIAVFSAGAIIGFYFYQQFELNRNVRESINSIGQMFQNILDSDARSMTGLIDL